MIYELQTNDASTNTYAAALQSNYKINLRTTSHASLSFLKKHYIPILVDSSLIQQITEALYSDIPQLNQKIYRISAY